MTPILDAHGRVWKLVPVEATIPMLAAGAEKLPDYDPGCDNAANCYTSMLQAAPAFQPGEGLVDSIAEAICETDPDAAGWQNMSKDYQARMRYISRYILTTIFGGKHE